jgi:hypothetical protein
VVVNIVYELHLHGLIPKKGQNAAGKMAGDTLAALRQPLRFDGFSSSDDMSVAEFRGWESYSNVWHNYKEKDRGWRRRER